MPLVIDACHSGKIFDHKLNPLDTYIPQKSTLIHPKETCGKKALTIISSGFDDETVPISDFIDEVIYQLVSNNEYALTSEHLFYKIMRKDFNAQKPVFAKSKNCPENQCLKSDFIFFKQ